LRSVWLLGVAAWFSMGAATAAQLALVADLQGRVVVQRAGATQAVDILAPLAGGETLALDPGARLTVVYLASGAEFEAQGPGQIQVGPTQLQASAGARVARRASPLAGATTQFAAGGGVIQGAVRMRSLGKPAVRLTGPQGKLLQPPTAFAWESAAPAGASYGFELMEDGPSGRVTLWKQETQAREIAPPQLAWAADRSYRWSLSFAQASGQPGKLEAIFQIADPTEVARWQRLRPPPDAPLSDWVVYAGLLKEANFLADARAVWSDLARQRPDSAALKNLAQP
jgi:hypothetical protein